MKTRIIGILFVLLLLVGCTAEQSNGKAESTIETGKTEPPPPTTSDQQILSEYDDDLDAALADLELIE